jgi:hypothetical protein
MAPLIMMTFHEAELGSPKTLQELLLELNHERLAIHIGFAPLDREETRDRVPGMFPNQA